MKIKGGEKPGGSPILFPQPLGLWKGRVWHCRQGACHIKCYFLTASRGTGKHLGGLAVDIGVSSFPMVICFGESGKSIFPQIADISDLFDCFLGILHTPTSEMYRSIRYEINEDSSPFEFQVGH